MKPLPQPLRKPRPTTPLFLGFPILVSACRGTRTRSTIRPGTAAARCPVLLLL